MSRVVQIRKLQFMCDNELCMTDAEFEVTSLVMNETFGEMTQISCYCTEHLPIQIQNVWRDMERGY